MDQINPNQAINTRLLSELYSENNDVVGFNKSDIEESDSHKGVVEYMNHALMVENEFVSCDYNNNSSHNVYSTNNDVYVEDAETPNIIEAINTNMVSSCPSDSDFSEEEDSKKNSIAAVNEDGYIVEFLGQSSDIVGP